jgi:hypothetical protein
MKILNKYFFQENGYISKVEELSIDGKTVVSFDGKESTEAAYEKQEANLKAIRDKAQAEQQQKAQDQAIEREAIDEVIREQFSKQIAERVAKKKSELEKQRKG